MLLHLNHDCKRKYSLVFLSINNAIDREYNKYIKGKKFVKSLFDAVIFCSAFTRYLMILVILFGPFQNRLIVTSIFISYWSCPIFYDITGDSIVLWKQGERVLSAGPIQVRKDFRMTLVEAASLRITNVHVSDTGNKKSNINVNSSLRSVNNVLMTKNSYVFSLTFDIKEITHVKWSGEVNPCILYIN